MDRKPVETKQGVGRRNPVGSRGRPRVGLLVLLLGTLSVGPWAQFAPASFWEGFPGFGHAWVATDGPYNEHLVRDVGGLQLGMAVVLLAALARPTESSLRVAALASVAWQSPHAVYHFAHVGDLPTLADRVAQSVLLVLTLAVALTLLLMSLRRERAVRSRGDGCFPPSTRDG